MGCALGDLLGYLENDLNPDTRFGIPEQLLTTFNNGHSVSIMDVDREHNSLKNGGEKMPYLSGKVVSPVLSELHSCSAQLGGNF